MFDKLKALFGSGSGAAKVPSVGDAMWWRGMRCVITGINHDRGIFHYETVAKHSQRGKAMPYYRLTSALADLLYDAERGFFYMRGVEGVMPKPGRSDPSLPTCDACGAVTHRRQFCTNCRLASGAPAVLAASEGGN